MNDWDYLKPSLAPQEAYSDSSARTRLPSPFPHDEEAAVDALSLRTIDDGIVRRPSPHPTRRRTVQPSPSRLLGPRYLCFVANEQATPRSYVTQRVESWMSHNQTYNEPDYIFISYTRRQFYSQINNDPAVSSDDLVNRKEAADRDQSILTRFAVKAAKDAGVPAFWIDFECVQPEDADSEEGDMEDVYRICDIVRASHSLTIISGPSLDDRLERTVSDNSTSAEWLLDWGKRLWTLPEALLCPSEHRISIYAVGREAPETIAKRNLPSRLWDDAGIIRQLIDHYEASLQLTQLELISIALDCLQRRQTETRNAGDVAYALMGLLRLRPKVDKSDTDFQAFARLSLANDSDMILERLICLRSPDNAASWHDMQDSWEAKLWHIDPGFQISDIGPNNAVIVGDAAGTSIDWNSLEMVDFTGTASSYTFCWRYVRLVSGYIIGHFLAYLMGIFVLFPIKRGYTANPWTFGKAMMIAGYTWTLWGLLAIPVPFLLGRFFNGEVTSAQARIFGVAGIPDIAQVERHVFGGAHGRLHWNIDGSVAELGEGDDQRPVFTLVDTLSMSLTTFRSNKPPTMLFVGGRERGMLRVLLCSYDVASRSFVKETVARMETGMSTRLPRLDRFRFSAQPAAETVQEDSVELGENAIYDEDLIELPDIPEFISIDD